MAGSAGWAVTAYWELVLLLEQRNSFIVKICFCSQAFVTGVRICKVTGTREPELKGGSFLVVFDETRLEDGLLGSVIKMLTNILNFLQRCQLLRKKMTEFFPNFRSETIYRNRAASTFNVSIFLEKRGSSFQ